jgi:tetratricopeptide (TPR) repeat protein
MEPLAMGEVAIGVLLLKKSAETTSERLTQEVLEPILPQIRTAVGALVAPMRDQVAALGDRVAARLPAANLKNPFDDWTLLEAIVLAEAADPATAATVSEVAASLPAINSKIDQQKTGVMFNNPVERVAVELSWQALSQKAQRLAVLLGCFGSAPVLWEWVQGCWPSDDQEELKAARAELERLSLLERLGDRQYGLHPLIREFFAAQRAGWPEGEALQQAFLGQMVSVAKTVPDTVTLADLARTRPAWPHLEAAATNSAKIADPTDSIWPFVALARLAEGQGLWSEAEQHYSDCITTTEHRFGPDHPETASSLNNLANLYESQGRYEAAEPLYRRSLDIRERLLGVDHPDTATSLNNLAALYESQGKYEAAEPLYRRSLEIRERALGADHPDTANSLNGLAVLYKSQGKYEAAEPLFRRSLAIREQVMGADHPDTAVSLNNLAALYESQGRYEAAEPLYRRSLAIKEQVMGADHPLTANSLNNLAVLHCHQNRWGEAERLLLRAWKIRVQQLGETHPHTQSSLRSLYSLVQAALQQGRAAELSDHPLTQAILKQLTTPPEIP